MNYGMVSKDKPCELNTHTPLKLCNWAKQCSVEQNLFNQGTSNGLTYRKHPKAEPMIPVKLTFGKLCYDKQYRKAFYDRMQNKIKYFL